MVYKGEYRRSPDSKGTEVAIKTIKANQATDDFIKEMKVMSRLIHPNIVRFYGLVQRQGTILLSILMYMYAYTSFVTNITGGGGGATSSYQVYGVGSH